MPAIPLVALALAAAGCDLDGRLDENAQLQEFRCVEGRYKVLMQGKPARQTQWALGCEMVVHMLEGRDGGYGVAYADMAPLVGSGPLNARQIDGGLEGAREGAILNVKGRQLWSRRATLDGSVPGREFEAEIPDKKWVLHAKLFLVHKRLYQLVVMGPDKFVHSHKADKFLDSFELLSP
jgi:hypothetical protein